MSDNIIQVLLIDDDEDNHLFTRQALTDAGAGQFRVECVDSYQAGLEAIVRGSYDVCLLDYRLGERTGLDFLHETARLNCETPIILLTGQGGYDVDIGAMEAGAADYLDKERISGPVLERTIRYVLMHQEKTRLERERNSLRAAICDQEQVLGVIGHELRTPLAALRATSEFLLTEDARETDEWDVFLRSMNDEVIRMTNMVNDLLEAARLNSGSARWKWSRVRLEDVCQAALDQIRPLVDHGRVHLESLVDPAKLTMMGDEDAIRRLVLNLVSNAHKHTKEGSIRVVACVVDEAEGDVVEIEIQDTGEGIRPEIADQLGTAFVLNAGIAGAKYVEGTGLGLFICKGIVAAHGGTMAIRSAPGKGTTVTVHLRAALTDPVPVSDDLRIDQDIAA